MPIAQQFWHIACTTSWIAFALFFLWISVCAISCALFQLCRNGAVFCDEEEVVQLVKYVRKLDVESISHMIGDHQTFHTQTSTAAYISAQQWWWDGYDDSWWWWWRIKECNVIVYSSEKFGTTCRVNLCTMSWLRMDWKMQVWAPSKNKKKGKLISNHCYIIFWSLPKCKIKSYT